MSYKITVKNHASQNTLVVKGKASFAEAGQAIESSIAAVAKHLEAQGIEALGAPFTRTFSHEGGSLEFECGFPVKNASTGGSLKAASLPAGEVVTTVHTGGQDSSEEAYKALHVWMEKNGKQPAGAPWEVYSDRESMEVYFPIR